MSDKQAKDQQVKKDVAIKVGLKEIKMSQLPSFTLADKINLKKQGLDLTKLDDPEKEAKVALYVLQKLDPSITWDEVLLLPYSHAIRVILEYATKDALDLPFLMRSTSSVAPTAGQSTT